MADQELFVTVVDVSSKSGTSKAGNAYTLYTVTLSDGNTYKTFNNETGTEANALRGQPVKAMVHTEQRDGFPDNLFIDSVTAMDETVTVSSSPTGTPTLDTANGVVHQLNDPGVATRPVLSREEEIRRQFAIKAAANYIASNGTGDAQADSKTILILAQEFYRAALEGLDTEVPSQTW